MQYAQNTNRVFVEYVEFTKTPLTRAIFNAIKGVQTVLAGKSTYIQHTIYFQKGSLKGFKRTVKKYQTTPGIRLFFYLEKADTWAFICIAKRSGST